MGKFDRLEKCPKTGKMMHPTKASALDQYASLERAGKGDSNTCPYWCRFCQSWHLGHDRKRLNSSGEQALRNTLKAGKTGHRIAGRRRTR